MKWFKFNVKKENTNYDGTSKHLREDLNLYKAISTRIIIFVVVIGLLASLLIGRLFSVQIMNNAYYEDLVARKELSPVKLDNSRGIIKDRNGVVLTTNTPFNNITYHSVGRMNSKTRFELAKKFAAQFKGDYELNDFESRDLYIFLNNNGADLVTKEDTKGLSANEVNKLKRERVSDAMLASLTKEDIEGFSVYLKMGTETSTSAALVLEDASDQMIAYLVEHQQDFEGFGWNTTWKREYTGPEGYEFLIGKVRDIPSEKYEYMMAKGYAPNDKVGISGLEYMYEDYLVGTKTLMRYNATTKTYELASEGKKGNDVVLTLDMELQKKIEERVMREYRSAKGVARRDLMNSLDVVLTDPNTGDILAIVAIREDSKGNLYNSPESVFLDARPVGSVVKGATVYMGLAEGVIKPGETIMDAPMHIKGTQPRISYANLGPVTDQTALSRSSNIFMFNVAIRLGKGRYIPDQPLLFSKPVEETFSLMRNYYSQFGLGVNTMVDFPNEQTGYKGITKNGGLLLELSIGQYDSYTPIQLNQYMATIANGGYRMKPHLVKEVVDSDTKNIVYENVPTVLNQVEDQLALNRARSGFKLCVTNGGCGAGMRNLGMSSAAKTGTAQYTDRGINLINNAYIAFAPYESPKVAVSCINGAAYRDTGSSLPNICRTLTPDLIRIYMNHK